MPRPVDRTLPLPASASLLQELREMRRRDEEEAADSTAARGRWVDAVEQLLGWIRGWLRQPETEGLVRIEAASVHLRDDDTGAYDAPALRVTLPGGRTVWVRPIGTLRVGARGLVDLVCGSNRALLVLNRAGIWKVRASRPSAPLVVLDAESFAAALQELIQ